MFPGEGGGQMRPMSMFDNLPLLCAKCYEIWDTQHTGILRDCTGMVLPCNVLLLYHYTCVMY